MPGRPARVSTGGKHRFLWYAQFGSLDEALQERNPGNRTAKPTPPDYVSLHPGYTFLYGQLWNH